MRLLIAALGAVLMMAAPQGVAQEALFVTTVRGVPMTEPDPPLHEEGRVRAEKWAEVLAKAGIDAVFSNDRRRTMQLAEPLAKALGLDVIPHPKWEMETLAERLKTDHANDRVFLALGETNVFQLMQALGFDELYGSMRAEDITVVIPRPDDKPVIILMQVE